MTVPPLPKSFEEAAHLQTAVEQELDRICLSPRFRSSRKSCEFLRYVVRVALDGRIDSLKERSIGIDLLGRDASYDPSSDATVRVRANEVRKRLSSFYADDHESGTFRIVLPAGGYVPQFLPWTAENERQYGTASEGSDDSRKNDGTTPLATEAADAEPPELNIVILMRPALIALFLCVLLLRQQIEDRGNHLLFWDHLLQGRSAMTISLGGELANAPAELEKSIHPLIWLSGRYGIYPRISYSDNDKAQSPDDAHLHLSFLSPPELVENSRLPFLIKDAGGSRALIDRSSGSDRKSGKRAALLTVLPNHNGAVWIQGTDSDAILKLTESLIQEQNFPASLNTGISQKTPSELVMTIDENGICTTHTYGPRS